MRRRTRHVPLIFHSSERIQIWLCHRFHQQTFSKIWGNIESAQDTRYEIALQERRKHRHPCIHSADSLSRIRFDRAARTRSPNTFYLFSWLIQLLTQKCQRHDNLLVLLVQVRNSKEIAAHFLRLSRQSIEATRLYIKRRLSLIN